MSVRAKFTVTAIERTASSKVKADDKGQPIKNNEGRYDYEPCELHTIKMVPVYGNADPTHENSKFWAASPNGSLTLGCVNADAVASLELGKEFYIDFTPAD